MRLAVVTTPPGDRSAVGERVRAWLPHLCEHFRVQEFVDCGRGAAGEALPSDRLRARDFDQILFLLGNEASHAFMLPILRALGGAVVQHDWPLVALATAAQPALARGGVRGTLAALREGGFREARAYRALSRGQADPAAQHAATVDLGRAQLTLNRSVVRHADAFLVASEEMKSRILLDRNSATPIGVVPGITGLRDGGDSWPAVARQVAECLSRFPPPRSRRTSLIQSAIAASRRGATE